MPPEKHDNRIAAYFTKTEIKKLESEKERLSEDSTSKVIVKIVKQYFEDREQIIAEGVSDIHTDYGENPIKLPDDEFRRYILKEQKALRAEINELKKKDNKK